MKTEIYINKILKKTGKSKRDMYRLHNLSLEFNLPFDIIYGIYLIETTFRPTYFRIGEYCIVIVSLLLSLLFKMPIKNYTIGRCQIGIGTILSYFGYNNATYYSQMISCINFRQAVLIVKSFFFNYNSKIFVWRLRILYKNSNIDNYSNMIRNIGYAYNGKMIYGLLLEKLINECMLLNYCSIQFPSRA